MSASTEAALKFNANIPALFYGMLNFLDTMHRDNPIWSLAATPQSVQLLDRASLGAEREAESLSRHLVFVPLPENPDFIAESDEALLIAEDHSTVVDDESLVAIAW